VQAVTFRERPPDRLAGTGLPRYSALMIFALALAATLSQAPAKEVKVIKSNRAARTVAAKTQAELNAEARAEDLKLRCAEDPAACNGASPDAKSKELTAKEEALRRKEAELAEREEAMRKKQEEEKEEKEKTEKQRAEAKKHVEKQAKQLEQTMQGLGGALAGEE
jgi:hypothetical protein